MNSKNNGEGFSGGGATGNDDDDDDDHSLRRDNLMFALFTAAGGNDETDGSREERLTRLYSILQEAIEISSQEERRSNDNETQMEGGSPNDVTAQPHLTLRNDNLSLQSAIARAVRAQHGLNQEANRLFRIAFQRSASDESTVEQRHGENDNNGGNASPNEAPNTDVREQNSIRPSIARSSSSRRSMHRRHSSEGSLMLHSNGNERESIHPIIHRSSSYRDLNPFIEDDNCEEAPGETASSTSPRMSRPRAIAVLHQETSNQRDEVSSSDSQNINRRRIRRVRRASAA